MSATGDCSGSTGRSTSIERCNDEKDHCSKSLSWAQAVPRCYSSSRDKAKAERITNGPVVKKTTDTVAEISWSTDAQGSSIVKYGTTPTALNATAEAPWGGTKEQNGDPYHIV